MNLNLHIAIPSTSEWKAKFGMSLAGLCMNYMAGPIPGVEEQRIKLHNKRGSILPALREKLVMEALEDNATHVLFLDSDQTFPPTTIHRLLEWKIPVVACNIAVKNFPTAPTARRRSIEKPEGEVIYTLPGMIGLERVWRVGCGVMLIDTGVFKHMKQPWFGTRWAEDKKDFVGEDWVFAENLEAAGYHVYVDHGLSWEIGHVGDLEYVHSFCKAEQRLIQALGVSPRFKEKAPEMVPIIAG